MIRLGPSVYSLVLARELVLAGAVMQGPGRERGDAGHRVAPCMFDCPGGELGFAYGHATKFQFVLDGHESLENLPAATCHEHNLT